MVKKSGTAQMLMVEGYELTGDVGSGEFSGTIAQLEQPGLSGTSMFRVRGRRDASLTFQSYFNDAANRSHVSLTGLLADRAQKIVLWALQRTAGAAGIVFTSRVVQPYQRDAGADGSFTGTTTAVADGVVIENVVMLTSALDTHASATSSASIDDNGGSSANGASAYVFVNDFDSGTPTFILEDSTDDAVFATLISFGAVANKAAARATVAGTVNQFLQATTTGTFTNADFAMCIRRGTANDYAT